MHSLGITGVGELRGQMANPDSPGKWPLKWNVCVDTVGWVAGRESDMCRNGRQCLKELTSLARTC